MQGSLVVTTKPYNSAKDMHSMHGRYFVKGEGGCDTYVPTKRIDNSYQIKDVMFM